jgi:hypothetical protein
LSPQKDVIDGSQGTINIVAACARIHWSKGQFDTGFELFFTVLRQNQTMFTPFAAQRLLPKQCAKRLRHAAATT